MIVANGDKGSLVMKNNIRGIKCSIDYYQLKEFLKFLTNRPWDFYMPWCLLDDMVPIMSPKMLLPNLSTFENHNIWEMELQCFPPNMEYVHVTDYQAFCSSPCECCLLYYDCGYLEIYVKQRDCFQQFWGYLKCCETEDLQFITDWNDTRTGFSVG